jgi:glucuronosyltransferase
MGSGLYSSDMPDNKVQQFIEVFSKQKQRVLWKWEKDSLPGKPKNVKIGKWFPQSDILGELKCLNPYPANVENKVSS